MELIQSQTQQLQLPDKKNANGAIISSTARKREKKRHILDGWSTTQHETLQLVCSLWHILYTLFSCLFALFYWSNDKRDKIDWLLTKLLVNKE